MRIDQRWATVPLVLAVLALLVTTPRLLSARALSEAKFLRGASDPADRARRVELVDRAIVRDPENLEALYERLQIVAEDGDPAAILEAHAAVEAVGPCFQDGAAIVALALAHRGELEQAIAVHRAFLAVHAHDVRARVRTAALTVLTGDIERVTAELESLLQLAVTLIELEQGPGWSIANIEFEGLPALRITRPDGSAVTVARNDLPWLLLRESPRSSVHAEHLLATHLSDFVLGRLGVEGLPMLQSLRETFLRGGAPLLPPGSNGSAAEPAE